MSGKHVRRGFSLAMRRLPFDWTPTRPPKVIEVKKEFKPQNRRERRMLIKIQRGRK